jgi:deoxyribonuclease-4
MPPLGAHVSVTGGLHHAFTRGQDIGCDSLQIFIKSPNTWHAKPLAAKQVGLYREAHQAHGAPPVVAHAAYLINLCATNPETLQKSRAGLGDELLRCSQLGVQGLVVHPGAHLGEGEACGIDGIAASIDAIFAEHPEITTRILLENTAGQGTTLGTSFAQLEQIIARTDAPERLGVCLDTCHAFAAGYDLTAPDGYARMLDEFERTLGLQRLVCLHLNDSKYPLGSRKDRHENIGQGEIGLEFFQRLLQDERLTHTPMLLETPIGDDEQGHKRDLELLRSLSCSG